MKTSPSLSPNNYRALALDTVLDYVASIPTLKPVLGDNRSMWKAKEIGDGNLNLVFIVTGAHGRLCVKQALPYVRMVGEGWPLSLSRALFEHAALAQHAKYAARYVPSIYHHDAAMALTIMECLTPHIILRKGLVQGTAYPLAARHLGEFLALTLYHTSDLHLPASSKKKNLAFFADNTAMCKISEDLIFDEPYYQAPMNRHTPGLEDIARAFQHDAPLKEAAQDMKWKFLNHAEALLHGDLHTGSVMVTENDTRVIDPEFAFYGPMGFDSGALIANFLLAAFAQKGHAREPGGRDAYAQWILEQVITFWDSFASSFADLQKKRDSEHPGGDVFAPRVETSDKVIARCLDAVWQDTLGFAGLKMIRRILGLAHVEDFESIADSADRAACERRALMFARSLVVNRELYPSAKALIQRVEL